MIWLAITAEIRFEKGLSRELAASRAPLTSYSSARSLSCLLSVPVSHVAL